MHCKHVCPRDAQATLKQEALEVIWQKWAQDEVYKELCPRPYLPPVLTWLRKQKDSTTAAMVRAAICRRRFIQATLHAWGQAATVQRKACGEAGGTEAHRLYQRTANRSQRLAVAARTTR